MREQYFNFKTHCFHQSYSVWPSPLLVFGATGKSIMGGEKALRGKVYSCSLGKGSVLLVSPMKFIFMTRKMNVLGVALLPCSSESLYSLERAHNQRSRVVNIWGVISELRLPFFSCEEIGLNSSKQFQRT